MHKGKKKQEETEGDGSFEENRQSKRDHVTARGQRRGTETGCRWNVAKRGIKKANWFMLEKKREKLWQEENNRLIWCTPHQTRFSGAFVRRDNPSVHMYKTVWVHRESILPHFVGVYAKETPLCTSAVSVGTLWPVLWLPTDFWRSVPKNFHHHYKTKENE